MEYRRRRTSKLGSQCLPAPSARNFSTSILVERSSLQRRQVCDRCCSDSYTHSTHSIMKGRRSGPRMYARLSKANGRNRRDGRVIDRLAEMRRIGNSEGKMISFTERDAGKYSVGRAIIAAANGPKHSCFEREVSDDLAKSVGRPPRSSAGIFIPNRLRPTMSGLDTKTNVGGGYTVPRR